jgi:hypothetical protein
MLTPPITGLIVSAVILAGGFARWAARRHLTDETKSVVSVSMAVIVTVSALVLGLLISNANTLFIARGGEVTALSADLLRLDQMLGLYGREADPARAALQQYAKRKMADLFPQDPADVRVDDPSTYQLLQQVE